MTNIYKTFTYKTAAKLNWHRYGTELRHRYPMYIRADPAEGSTAPGAKCGVYTCDLSAGCPQALWRGRRAAAHRVCQCAAAVCFQLLIIFILPLAHYVFELSVRLCVRACVPAPGGGIAVEFYFSYSYSYLSVIYLFPSVL